MLHIKRLILHYLLCFEVKPQFLQAGIDKIRKDHGSVDNYLTKVLNVDITKMRDKYLY